MLGRATHLPVGVLPAAAAALRLLAPLLKAGRFVRHAHGEAAAPAGSPAERYAALLAQGALRPDPEQARCVARLQILHEQLPAYAAAAAAHRTRLREHEERRVELAGRLREEERQALEVELASSAPEHRRGPATGWRGSLLDWAAGALGVARHPASARGLSEEQRRSRVEARVADRVAEELEPPPPPPHAPRGELRGPGNGGTTARLPEPHHHADGGVLAGPPARQRAAC
jgi:hypothetical protein